MKKKIFDPCMGCDHCKKETCRFFKAKEKLIKAKADLKKLKEENAQLKNKLNYIKSGDPKWSIK